MTPTIATIRRAVAEAAGITEAELLSDSRERRIARPRQIAMYLARRLTKLGIVALGLHFNRDGTTVLNGVTVVTEALWLRCPDVIAVVDAARVALGKRPSGYIPAGKPREFQPKVREKKRQPRAPVKTPPPLDWAALMAGRRFEDVVVRDDGPFRRLPPPTLTAGATGLAR
jgi:hypothetical protein